MKVMSECIEICIHYRFYLLLFLFFLVLWTICFAKFELLLSSGNFALYSVPVKKLACYKCTLSKRVSVFLVYVFYILEMI